MPTSISLQIDSVKTFSLAAQQNSYPIVKALRVVYQADKVENELQHPVLTNLKVKLEAIDGWLIEKEWLIDEIRPKQLIDLSSLELKFPLEKLFGLTEQLTLELNFKISNSSNEVIATSTIDVDVLPANYWGGESRQPDLLAAFVRPNGVYVESLVKQVTEVLEREGHGRSANGYQSNTREKPYLMVAALWNVIFQQKLAYVSPPQGFAKYGQRIRLAADISSSKIAACLDTSLLFASCIEAMGLNPIVALTKDHAFTGAWLINERLPVLTNDDPMDVRKRVDNRDIVFFETTLVSNSKPITFTQSAEYARTLISEEHESDFVYVIDIAQARARQIKPLSTIEEARIEIVADVQVDLPLSPTPPLPPVRGDERLEEDNPETRIDTWSRKLLDLSKRNSLLNFSDRAVSIKIFCPNIAAFEDMLADGQKFQFVSAEESPINDRERDPESFRMQNGADIHRKYALNQLSNQILIANQSISRMEKNAIALFRKAKNDLEEGGSNTLYLALGMLKWKENPEDDRSFRAPLILLPVTLTRKSARSAIYLSLLPDEEPIFNLTLIEFLQAEQDINLSEFKDELPKDDSGIDVPYIWHRVREAISEHRGFEVSEELVLASFSFSKYLMWKDLRERLDDLKQNPFVKHLVDAPREPYPQESFFVERSEIDKKIDFSQIYTPLNCDSSQLVAVEASAKSQDFVLEGPPGTGKSETIANIIAHNIGMGRTVLFVAEKMAALNVVYRRMQKVGLDHLCLELHSNKTNKRAVLDQLGKAWGKRNGLNQNTWEMNLAELKQKREQLNAYVAALHHKCSVGLSVRDTIATLAQNLSSLTFDLDWELDLNASPIQTEEQMRSTTQMVKNIAVAFNDISNLDAVMFNLVKTTHWSNVWQSQLLVLLEQTAECLPEAVQTSFKLLKLFDIDSRNITLLDIQKLECLGLLIEMSVKEPIGFAIEKGAKERILALDSISKLKFQLDSHLTNTKLGITPDQLQQVPIKEWVTFAEEAKSGWFKALLSKWKINTAGKKLGLVKITDLTVISVINDAISIKSELEKHLSTIDGFDLWKGWDTTSDYLEDRYHKGEQVRQYLSTVLSIVDDPIPVLISIKKWLVDGRDYLDNSKVYSTWQQLESQHIALKDLQTQLTDAGVNISNEQSLEAVVEDIKNIILNKTKLKNWCEWQAAKSQAINGRLASLIMALEAGKISPENTEKQFFVAYCKWLAPLLIDDNSLLREFKASTHELTISKFRELDAKVADITSQYVITLASQKVPNPSSRNNPVEYGTLSRELQKKTRHIPTRSLIQEMGGSLLNLCPCLMMSPLSVAQFLPADFHGVDLVVFDEASQMTTWDSVGAIARGKNVIIVGDPKQMPPTNFFSAQAANDEADEEDLESILDQALAARLPLKRLMGHYRSRHETLIAFSNSKYYENSLVTYPSSDTKESMVTSHRVNGVYAKGKGRNNAIEAKAVVDEIVKRLVNPSEKKKSIGVVTLNTEQQRMIEDLLDDARRKNPLIEEFFHDSEGKDPIFVKNLESVQGDERDIIMLSLGYGPTEPEAKTMSMNFGPLNKTGGERRLNVAITRATTEVLIFSSFDSSMIDLSRTSARAVEDLKHYLEFAERGPVALAEQATATYGIDQFDSDFEQAVAAALRAKGWKVQTQVGVSKFRVDLGVLHPDKPGRYLAGVECDGATYHSSPSARDRDRVRHVILENLGWHLIRLWSTDFFIDADSAIDKIHSQLEQQLAMDRAETIKEADNNEKVEYIADEPEDLAMTGIYAKSQIQEDINIAKPIADIETENDDYRFAAADYFKDSHKQQLSVIAKEILEEKPGITLHVLALDIANMHGLTRTSKKQRDYLLSIIVSWAGLVEIEGWEHTLWASPELISAEVNWRGCNAFGYPRLWSEISYQEAMGLVRIALQKAPNDPVDFICSEFKLKRRHEKTVKTFQGWIALFNEKGLPDFK
ncbi:DUF4011 domain-containing protein [Shewanella vesiculosa]|uniref:DUF4011 domain-containing protein n=1 Tax=Shewanella vesiculosa TaxID=518738 RepID=UPI00384F8751